MHDRRRRALVFVVDHEPFNTETAAMVLCGHGFDPGDFTDSILDGKAARIGELDLPMRHVPNSQV